jgi:hypothetical protein
MYLKSFCSILLLSISSILCAQTLKSWTWDYYKIKFKAPDNMVVQENSDKKFQASNVSIVMDIYPRVGENLTYDGMKNAIIDWANKTNLSYNSDSNPVYLKDINRYWGCAIDGTNNDFPTSILLLVDPDYSNISFYIWISYKSEYYHDVVAILKSFEPVR